MTLSKEDQKVYANKHYADNKDAYRDRVKARRRLFSRITTELKTADPCTDCGIYYPHYVMDFDHLPGTDKKFHVSDFRVISSVVALLDEIDKCELVCANCHRIRTYTRYPDFPLLV